MSLTATVTPGIDYEKAIIRIDGLSNKLTLAICAVKTRYCLVGVEHQENKVILDIRVRNDPFDAVSENDETIKEEELKAMLSYNACTMTVQYLSGLVAFLIEENDLPVAVSESHIHGVVPERVVRTRNEGEGLADIATKHTMLKYTSTDSNLDALLGSGGAYSDATSWQYWREQGFRKVSTYPVIRTELSEVFDTENLLGTEYRKILGKFVGGHLCEKTIMQRSIDRTETRIRAVNNALYNTIMRLGGSKYIVTAGDAAWQEAEQIIVRAATASLLRLEYINCDWDTKADLCGFEDDGHWVFLAAMDRASHLGLIALASSICEQSAL